MGKLGQFGAGIFEGNLGFHGSIFSNDRKLLIALQQQLITPTCFMGIFSHGHIAK